MDTIYKKILIILIILAMISVLVVIATRIFIKQSIQQPFIQNRLPSSFMTATSSVSSAPVATSTVETKIYHNAEWGFEFKYPKNWSFEINSFRSPFSKFNLQGNTSDKNYNPFNPAFIINIVTPGFVEYQFSNLKNTASETIVGKVAGSKYVYEEQGEQITIILPFGQYKMIFGTEKQHEDVFNQILTTFKFLK